MKKLLLTTLILVSGLFAKSEIGLIGTEYKKEAAGIYYSSYMTDNSYTTLQYTKELARGDLLEDRNRLQLQVGYEFDNLIGCITPTAYVGGGYTFDNDIEDDDTYLVTGVGLSKTFSNNIVIGIGYEGRWVNDVDDYVDNGTIKIGYRF